MIIIGEKINGSIPSVAEAIAKRDAEFIKDRARKQAEAGATFIDCCASVPEEEEVETLKWMIDCIQEVTDLPISVDSPSADVLIQAYKFCKRPGRATRSTRFSLLWHRKKIKAGKLSLFSVMIPESRKMQQTDFAYLIRSWQKPKNTESLHQGSTLIRW